ncbi:hypothetical protein VCHA53O466_320033 [Vibrio chagasii]|nr:hypothetical protein VCHA53O466_320033 [Vibrio chagasii]
MEQEIQNKEVFITKGEHNQNLFSTSSYVEDDDSHYLEMNGECHWKVDEELFTQLDTVIEEDFIVSATHLCGYHIETEESSDATDYHYMVNKGTSLRQALKEFHSVVTNTHLFHEIAPRHYIVEGFHEGKSENNRYKGMKCISLVLGT